MSLDLATKQGRAANTAPYVPAALADHLSNLAVSHFNSGDINDAGYLALKISTALGDVDANTMPTSLLDGSGVEILTDGVELTLVKATADSNRILFTCPWVGVTYSYVNRPSEGITLVFDTSTGTPRWVAKI